MQISPGLPKPKEFFSLPRLRFVQFGIQKAYLQQPIKLKICLPIIHTSHSIATGGCQKSVELNNGMVEWNTGMI